MPKGFYDPASLPTNEDGYWTCTCESGGHLIIKRPQDERGCVCTQCRFEAGDLVLLGPGLHAGYVCYVVRAFVDGVALKLLDAVGPEFYIEGDDVLGLIRTGKRNTDLATFGVSLCAKAVEAEMSPADFDKCYGSRKKKKKTKAKKVKSADELLAEALIEAAKKAGLESELLDLLS